MFYGVRLTKGHCRIVHKAMKDRGCKTVSELLRLVLDDFCREVDHMRKVAIGPKRVLKQPTKSRPGYRILKGDERKAWLNEVEKSGGKPLTSGGWMTVKTRPMLSELERRYTEKCGHYLNIHVKKMNCNKPL